MEGYSTFFLLLTLVAGLGRFAAFALDPKIIGTNRKDTGIELIGLAKVSQPRVNFIALSASILRRFIVTHFGEKYFSRAKFWRVAAVTAFIVLGVFVTSHAVSETAWRLPSDDSALAAWPLSKKIIGIAACLLVLVVVNTVTDTLSISVVRHLIEPCKTVPLNEGAKRAMAKRLACLPLYGLAVYVLFVTTMNLAFSAIITIRGAMAGYPLLSDPILFKSVQYRILVTETVPRFIDPIGRGAAIQIGDANLLYFCFTPLLPAALLIITVGVGALLEVVDRMSDGQVSAALPEATSNGDQPKRRPILIAAVLLTVLGGLATIGLSLQ